MGYVQPDRAIKAVISVWEVKKIIFFKVNKINIA